MKIDLAEFRKYLVAHGYKETTPSGFPSTVDDYVKRIMKVCKEEHIELDQLSNEISYYCSIYDIGGAKEEEGAKSHRAVINALKRYKEYLK